MRFFDLRIEQKHQGTGLQRTHTREPPPCIVKGTQLIPTHAIAPEHLHVAGFQTPRPKPHKHVVYGPETWIVIQGSNECAYSDGRAQTKTLGRAVEVDEAK